MATVIRVPSFSENNLRERSSLLDLVSAGALSLHLESSEGYVAGDSIYVGIPGREGCEKAVIDAVVDAQHISLVAALTLGHSAYAPVVSVLGDLIHIYRALDVDGTVPADGSFSVYATRSIDPDQVMTYYTDSSGTSGYWYRWTYFNQVTSIETDLQDSTPVRGDDFGHYATLPEIRSEAGFANAVRLSDVDVDRQRRMAESEINSALSTYYTVPFKPVPGVINGLTIQLAAAMLQVFAYGNTSPYSTRLKDARTALQTYADASTPITDDNGQNLTTNEGVAYDFGDQPNQFTMGQIF